MANRMGNVELVKKLWDEGWNGGRVEVVDEVVAEHAVAHHDGAPAGNQAWKDAIRFYRGAFPDLHYRIEDLIDAGDKVIVRWTATGTDTLGFMGRPPTQKVATVTGINIYRAEGGLLVEHWDEWNLAGLMQALGVLPPMPAMP
jgi:predicted ester cyclase